MTEAMPFLQKYDITFLRPPTISPECISSLIDLVKDKDTDAANKEWGELRRTLESALPTTEER